MRFRAFLLSVAGDVSQLPHSSLIIFIFFFFFSRSDTIIDIWDKRKSSRFPQVISMKSSPSNFSPSASKFFSVSFCYRSWYKIFCICRKSAWRFACCETARSSASAQSSSPRSSRSSKTRRSPVESSLSSARRSSASSCPAWPRSSARRSRSALPTLCRMSSSPGAELAPSGSRPCSEDWTLQPADSRSASAASPWRRDATTWSLKQSVRSRRCRHAGSSSTSG